MKKIKFILITFLFFHTSSTAQTIIKGLVSNKTNLPIPFVNILIKTDSTNVILIYTYSKKNGKYNLKTTKKGSFYLTFSVLGYQPQTVPINLTTNTKEIIKNVILKEKNIKLNEIIVHVEKPITIKKDTITFNAKKFTKGNEQVVEDLLKNLPGISVDANGTIKVGNKEIEKVMVDGDDFFERGYKILTKNMPPNEIEKIELLQRYSNNKLLKNIEESDKVALNLVLKDDAKRQWFGNLKLGYEFTFKNNYTIQGNLMNFGKKNKYYFLTNLNNIGHDATGDVNHLIRPYRFGEPASIGDNQTAYNILNLSSYTPNFKATRTNFNNTELASLNAIFTLSNKVKLKTLAFFNWDENDFFRNSTQTFTTTTNNFINNENFFLRKKKIVGFGKIDLTYDISKTKMLELTTKYNNQKEKNKNNLIFNTKNTNESLKSRNYLFDQKIKYTNKFKKNKVLLLTGRYINENTPQNYILNPFFYQGLFPNFSNTNNIQQQSENKMQFIGFESHLLNRKRNGDLFELQIGNKYRKDKLTSKFSLKEDNTIIIQPINYQNNIEYSTNNLYVNSKYRLKLNRFALTGELNFHQLFNRLQQSSKTKQNPFFINPKISFDWEINTKNKIISSYSFTTKNSKITDIYTNHILRNFRSFEKGTGNFNQLNASTLVFNYQLGNWSDNFFANTFVLYVKNHDFFSTNSVIYQNYVLSNKTKIKDREMFTISSNINKYFRFISSNLKFKLNFSKSNYKNIVNNSDLRKVTSTNYNYGLELRSGFSGLFNYHIGTEWTTNQIKTTINNSFTNNTSFFDLSFNFNTKFNIQFQAERYYFGNTNKENNTYYFADIEAKYKLKKNGLIVSLSGKNLFNTKKFRTTSINDISTSTTEYRLLPRFLLLKLEYRF